MGMRINTGSGIDPKMVDQLVELERRPIKQLEERREKRLEEQKKFQEVVSLVRDLGNSLNALRNPTDFYKMKLESSHPDIVDGTVTNACLPGTYEVEVRNMAKTQKLLADAFPDKDKSSVGFGYMYIELEDGRSFDVDINPDESTLEDVARKINDANAGCRAMIINTKEYLESEDEDSYRLIVISEKSGKPAKVYIDPDTTWLEFKEQVTGRNLHMLFEDVPVFDEDNSVESLMNGLVLNAKRAEPGTKVNVTISYDVDETMKSIKGFVEAFNKVNDFVEEQIKIDPKTNQAGILGRDNSLRNLRRNLQSSLQANVMGNRYATLVDVGISTDPKTGALKLDESKLKAALSEDYVAVARLFAQSDKGPGIGTVMSDRVRDLQDSRAGILTSRDREFKSVLKNFDNDIAKAERLAAQRAEGIKRKFSALESLMGNLNAQGQAMQARLGGGAASG